MNKAFAFQEPDNEGLFVAVNGEVITGMARGLAIRLAEYYKGINLEAPDRQATIDFLDHTPSLFEQLAGELDYREGPTAMYNLGRIEGCPLDTDLYLGLTDLGDQVGISYLAGDGMEDLEARESFTIAIVIPKEQQDAFFADLAEVYAE